MTVDNQHSATASSPDGRADLTMRAVVQDKYGSADVLCPSRITRPEIADEEVLLSVQAAGLDRGTWHLMTGTPYLMRIIGFGFRKPKNRVPGIDVAGTVVAVGSAVTKFTVHHHLTQRNPPLINVLPGIADGALRVVPAVLPDSQPGGCGGSTSEPI